MNKHLGAVLGWKFNHAPGITTRAGVITGWPPELGPEPTEAQILAWRAEYDAAKIEPVDPVIEKLNKLEERLGKLEKGKP